jgi:predicted MFS family arabinose efflux permease
MFAGHAVSAIGSWAYNVALAVFVYEATGSAAWVAAASLGRFVPSLLFSPYGGVIAERYERRAVMLTIDILSTIWMTALALTAQFSGPVVLAIVFAGLTTIGGTAFFPAEAAMTPQLVGEKDLAAANSLNGIVGNGSVIIGPAIGAALLALGPPQVTFFINGVTFLFSAWCINHVQARSRSTDVTEGGSAGVLKQITVGFKALGESTTALVLVLMSVFASFLYGTDTVLFVIIGEDRLGTGPEGFGFLLAALGVGGIIAAPLVNRLSAAKRLGLVITIGMITYGLPTFFMQWVDEPAIAFALQVVRGAGTLVVDVLAVTALQRLLAPELIARVFGVYITLVLAAISLGAYLSPLFLDWWGLETTLVVLGVGVPGITLLMYPKIASIDRRNAQRLAELQPRVEWIEPLGIFNTASRTVLEALAGAATEMSVSAGGRIITEGDPADAFYVLTGGSVDVLARRDGREQRINTLEPGTFFGEIGLIEGIPRTASIVAVEDATMLRIEGEDFLSALTQSSASSNFLESAQVRLRRTNPDQEITASAIPSGDDTDEDGGDDGPAD